MTTLTQLDKCADRWFNNQMRRRGFAVEKKFTFWRKRGPLFDMFIPHILSGGELLRVHVSIWSPWADNELGEFEKFPPNHCLIGGTLAPEFPEEMVNGYLFDIDNDANIERALKDILQLIDSKVLKWLASVNSYNNYASYIGDKGFYPTPERQEQLKYRLKIAFQREPYL